MVQMEKGVGSFLGPAMLPVGSSYTISAEEVTFASATRRPQATISPLAASSPLLHHHHDRH